MSKQGNGALDALKEFLSKIEGDPSVVVHRAVIGKDHVDQHPLQAVFDRCIEQAASGKGEERHGKGREFFEQPWVELARTHGIGFLTGQAEKKLKEAQSFDDVAAWEREMLGAINYAAMAILHRFVVDPACRGESGCCSSCEGRHHEG